MRRDREHVATPGPRSLQGMSIAPWQSMDNTRTNPPGQDPDTPRGDRGADKTWEPPAGEQGISNRAGDESEPEGNESTETNESTADGDTKHRPPS
jgi:hypothetical protein